MGIGIGLESLGCDHIETLVETEGGLDWRQGALRAPRQTY